METDAMFASLDKFASLFPQINAWDFMYMGTATCAVSGTPIDLYKHCDTRRYLNIDAAGHAYRYDGRTNSYYALTNAMSAIDVVLS